MWKCGTHGNLLMATSGLGLIGFLGLGHLLKLFLAWNIDEAFKEAIGLMALIALAELVAEGVEVDLHSKVSQENVIRVLEEGGNT